MSKWNNIKCFRYNPSLLKFGPTKVELECNKFLEYLGQSPSVFPIIERPSRSFAYLQKCKLIPRAVVVIIIIARHRI